MGKKGEKIKRNKNIEIKWIGEKSGSKWNKKKRFVCPQNHKHIDHVLEALLRSEKLSRFLLFCGAIIYLKKQIRGKVYYVILFISF